MVNPITGTFFLMHTEYELLKYNINIKKDSARNNKYTANV